MPSAMYAPEARDDIDIAFQQYEARNPGLGDRFLDQLRRTVGRIETNPLLYGEVFDGVRATGLRRFPYVVYYREQAGQVLIIAVRHGHDDPTVWQGRA